MANKGVDIGKAFVQIVPSAEGITGKVKALVDHEGETAGESLGKKLFDKFKTVITALEIGKVVGDALSQGGQLEQSIGGVETLFKDSAEVVKNNALQAFQTVGMSANEYMQNVTGFSASLLQSLGGDTAAAASVADMAMTDMADNANKMGTSLDSITTAYQGFAKQNYTMLDNLKLGYGGTKTEMQRLLKDAQKISGVKYDLSNLNDVYEAIHVIQKQMDISGYSTEQLKTKLKDMSLTEAELTKVASDMGISYDEALKRMNAGTLSVNDAQILLGTTAREAAVTLEGSANAMKASWKDFLGIITTGGAFGDVGTALKNLTSTFGTWAFGNLLPMLGRIAGNIPTIMTGLVDALQEYLPIVLESIPGIFSSLIDTITEQTPILLQSGGELIAQIANGIAQNLPIMLTKALELIQWLGNGIIAAIPALSTSAPQIITGIMNFISANLPSLLKSALDIVVELGVGLINSIPALVDGVMAVIEAIFNWFAEQDWAQLGVDIVNLLADGIRSLIETAVGAIGDVTTNVWNAVKDVDWLGLGADIISGIISGLGDVGKALYEKLKAGFDDAIGWAKALLNIGSPSKVMADEIGQWIPAGIAVGIEAKSDAISDAMNEMSNLIVDDALTMDLNAPMPSEFNPVPEKTINFSPTVNIYPSEGMDEERIGQVAVDKLVEVIKGENGVWAF